MEVMVSGKLAFFRLSHPLNASSLTETTPSVKMTSVIPVVFSEGRFIHPVCFVPTLVALKVTVLRALHPKNGERPVSSRGSEALEIG